MNGCQKCRISTQWSEFDQFIKNTKEIVDRSTLIECELTLLQRNRTDDMLQKSTPRQRFRCTQGPSRLGLTKEDAERLIAEREQKEKEADRKKKHTHFMKMWSGGQRNA